MPTYKHVNPQSASFRDHRRSSAPNGFREPAASVSMISSGVARCGWWSLLLILLLSGVHPNGTDPKGLNAREPLNAIKRLAATAGRKPTSEVTLPAVRYIFPLFLTAPATWNVARLGEAWRTDAVASSSGLLIPDHAGSPRGPPRP
jgi:hypothetical protein